MIQYLSKICGELKSGVDSPKSDWYQDPAETASRHRDQNGLTILVLGVKNVSFEFAFALGIGNR
jgi:hypothetical protein